MINVSSDYTNSQLTQGPIKVKPPLSRSDFFEREKENDKKYEEYNAAYEKNASGMSRDLDAIRKAPMAAINNKTIRLTDGEKELLHKIAEINGFSRQTTEFFYRLTLASGGADNITEFINNITGIEPGYYDDKDNSVHVLTVGLTESDRDNLLKNKSKEESNPSTENKSPEDNRKLDTQPKNPIIEINSNNLKLNEDEKGILHKIAEVNGVSWQTAEFFYKLSLVTGGVNNLTEFADSITEKEPGYYSNNGTPTVGLTKSDRESLFSVKV